MNEIINLFHVRSVPYSPYFSVSYLSRPFNRSVFLLYLILLYYYCHHLQLQPRYRPQSPVHGVRGWSRHSGPHQLPTQLFLLRHRHRLLGGRSSHTARSCRISGGYAHALQGELGDGRVSCVLWYTTRFNPLRQAWLFYSRKNSIVWRAYLTAL